MLNPAQTELQKRGHERGIGEAVLQRVLRLNPNPQEGMLLRGWHPAWSMKRRRFTQGDVGRGEFIREYGRDAWNRLPIGSVQKSGRHQYVTRETVEDRLWMLN